LSRVLQPSLKKWDFERFGSLLFSSVSGAKREGWGGSKGFKAQPRSTWDGFSKKHGLNKIEYFAVKKG